jgi:hypothetical protein
MCYCDVQGGWNLLLQERDYEMRIQVRLLQAAASYVHMVHRVATASRGKNPLAMELRPKATSLCKSTVFDSTKEHSTALFSVPTDEYDPPLVHESGGIQRWLHPVSHGCRRQCDSNTGRPQSNQKDSWLTVLGLILKLANGIISLSGSDGPREFKRWNVFLLDGLHTKLVHRYIQLCKYHHSKGHLDTTQFFQMVQKR